VNRAHLDFCGSDDWRQLVEDLVMPAALADVELGDDVLEIGPGPGFTTDVLRARTTNVTAVEIDEALAAALAARLQGTNVVVVRGDATALDFPAGRFSAVASFNMLHHVPSSPAQDRIFRELARVLRPGGVLVAADGVHSEATEAFHEGDTYNPIEAEAVAPRLHEAGFREVDVRTFDLGWVCRACVA
jgi:SAM-dependent methyltransferase